VSSLHATGGGTLVAMYCVNVREEPITPCGRCRQVLLDHGGAALQIATDDGVMTLGQLFPKP
jgi:cytidine deaminase